jgi:hypothetical protein
LHFRPLLFFTTLLPEHYFLRTFSPFTRFGLAKTVDQTNNLSKDGGQEIPTTNIEPKWKIGQIWVLFWEYSPPPSVPVGEFKNKSLLGKEFLQRGGQL